MDDVRGILGEAMDDPEDFKDVSVPSSVISDTAYQSGFGSDWWKKVYGLTKEEKKLACKGIPVYFISQALSGGSHGTFWRQAVDRGRFGFVPRVPSQSEIAKLESGQS